MNIMKRLIAGLVVGILTGGLLVACNGSSTADSGVSVSAFNSLKAQVASLSDTVSSQADTIASLKKTVAANQDALAAAAKVSKLYLTISAPNAAKVQTARLSTMSYGDSHSGLQTEATDTGCAIGNWTSNGSPPTANPMQTDVKAIISCGYLANVTAARQGDESLLQPLTPSNSTNESQIGYTGADCTGTPYVVADRNFADTAALSGAVFTYNKDHPMAAADYDDASNYWYVPAGTAKQNFVYTSYVILQSYGHQCMTGDSSQVPGYTMLPNDPSVTGIPSAPVPGPVLPSQVQ